MSAYSLNRAEAYRQRNKVMRQKQNKNTENIVRWPAGTKTYFTWMPNNRYLVQSSKIDCGTVGCSAILNYCQLDYSILWHISPPSRPQITFNKCFDVSLIPKSWHVHRTCEDIRGSVLHVGRSSNHQQNSKYLPHNSGVLINVVVREQSRAEPNESHSVHICCAACFAIVQFAELRQRTSITLLMLVVLLAYLRSVCFIRYQRNVGWMQKYALCSARCSFIISWLTMRCAVLFAIRE